MNKIHKDKRGYIEMLMENCSIGSISKIRTKKGHERANHYHPVDNHVIYISKGEMIIYERELENNEIPNIFTLKKGDLHFTNSEVVHTMFFPKSCEFYCFSKLPRNQDNYEKETIRVDYSLRDIYNKMEPTAKF